MPDVEIVKLKLRRGTDVQRQTVTLEQGELGYTTDGKRVWVGDGFTIGGNTIGNIAHPPLSVNTRTDLTTAATGDIVYEDGLLYQLSGTDAATLSSWGFIGARPDDLSIEYNPSNQLHLVAGGITAAKLSSDVIATNGGLSFNPVEGLSANVDGTSITVTTTGQLSVIGGNISSSNIGNGLSGGSGLVVGLDTTSSFTYTGSKLEFANAPISTVCACAINSATVSGGLEINSGSLQMETIGGGTVNPLDTSGYDSKGRVISRATTITQNVTGTDTTGNGAIFNGSIIDTVFSNQTLICASSSNSDQSSTITAVLTSAGFITFESGTCGNLAIPIFKY
jgi:hypothetical protein